MITIDRTTYRAPSFNERVRFLVLHYTNENLEGSLRDLLGPKVSVHYLVSDSNPNHIFQLVEESRRAWDVGVSGWQGRQNLNDTSIGIEIVNLGDTKDSQGNIHWYPYPEDQITAVMELCQNIITRYDIDPTCVIGHSDAAPGRKQDPGPLFPWKQLYDNNIGAWYDQDTVNALMPKVDLSNVKLIQEQFSKYGYVLQPTGIIDQQTTDVVVSFQMHFRPKNFSGILDVETVAILEALLQKYLM
ncbi:N-acetylmuramoyl-L-alanine amidase [Candidatus Tisiphia endosymbiont of Psammoecus bipunctatus]|uniref:N-acetylmuramoyl-L-alanine amidase n=1 Tax=Candidatus Tisiphia endosymbiont of Psammoecus bipunctatus TaxID=3139333 RepID=UPI0035C89FF7